MLVVYYVIALHINFLWLFGYMPKLSDVRNPQVAIATEIYTEDSVLLGKFYNENRTPVQFSAISKNAVDALVATEDVRFYQHHGLDLFALAGGIYSTTRGDERGASTITQQLAKNMYNIRKRKNQGLLQHVPFLNTIISKTKEWITSLKLEVFYSKDEILEMYFNTVDFGNNWYGIKVAAQNYFSKQPSQLNLEESATLIGLLKATSSYNPLTNKKRSRDRRNVVLSQMKKYGFISQQVADSVMQLPLKLNRAKNNPGTSDSYLKQLVYRIVKSECESKGLNIFEDGLKIYTTINSHLQLYAQQAVAEQMKKNQKQFDEQWRQQSPWRDDKGNEIKNFAESAIVYTPVYERLSKLYDGNKDSITVALNIKRPMKVFTYTGSKDTMFSYLDSLKYYAKILNTGMMSLNPVNGEIKAYVGGIDYNYFKFDHVWQSKRQAGSTFKPFAYLAAIEDTFSPCTRMNDVPVRIIYEGNQVWEPKNSTGGFTYTSKTLRRALAQSVNSITAQITEDVGWETVVEYAHLLGIRSALDTVPSICLGSSDVNVYEMVCAYAAFANGGKKTDPILVKSIYSNDGSLIQEFKPTFTQVISEENAWLMLYMLQGTLQEPGGTSQALWGYNVFPKGNEIAGKTGTTSNYSDAWYMGITHDLVTGVWVGAPYRSVHFRGASGQGSRLALPIFAKMMEKAYKDSESGVVPGKFVKPNTRIKKEYYCDMEDYDLSMTDSLAMDSLVADSLRIRNYHLFEADSLRDTIPVSGD
ncbi:MAG: transglycosylase domain-containing protein [Bacteroidetes bacterium]|nr:transglycosylase domain-containing protein [Bacteroidota bacterium]